MAGVYGVTENTDSELSQLTTVIPVLQKTITVASGEGALVRGQILEINTDFEYEALTVDPGTTARCILAEDIDATSAAVSCVAYFGGKYRYDDIVFAASTAALKQAALVALQDRGLIVDIDLSAVEATT